jgi:glyoxylase-like metal-dependent hydrolase (beta-lactamase superfamily II)
MTDFYQPQSVTLAPGLVMLPQFGSASGGTHRPMNSFALVFEERCVLFDAPLANAVPGIRKLVRDGVRPVACVLSHADLCGSGDAFDPLIGELEIPLMLHPRDQADRRAQRLGIDWGDPTAAGAFEDLPVEVLHWPGHTPGSIMLYTPEHGGILLTGDSAVAPGPMQPDEASPLARPPGRTADEDAAMVERWRGFHREPLTTLAPLHGHVYVDHGDIPGLIDAMLTAGSPASAVREFA